MKSEQCGGLPKNFRLLSLAFLVITFLLNGVQGYCFEDRLKIRTDLPTVKILTGGWDIQVAISMIGKILLEEKMGVKVKWFPTDSMAEYWDYDPNYPNSYRVWFEKQNIDIAFMMGAYHTKGPLAKMLYDGTLISNTIGVKETIGFFFPKYMAEEMLGLHWRYLRANTEARAKLIADAKPELPTTLPPIYGSVPSYMMSKQAIKMNKALNLSVNFTLMGSEGKLGDLVNDMYKYKKRFIIHHYTPTIEFANYEFAQVTLPFNPSGQNSDPCFNNSVCGWLDDPLVSVIHAHMKKTLPDVVFFTRRIDLNRTGMNDVIRRYYATKTDYYIYSEWESAVCSWLKDNRETWKNWIQTIPPTVPLWLIIIQWTAAGLGFALLSFLCWKLWKMTSVKASEHAQPVDVLRKKALRIEYATHLMYMLVDLFDVATDIWAVGTVFSIDIESGLFLPICYCVALAVSLIYTGFMYRQRVKYILDIRKEMVGAMELELFKSNFGELKRRYKNEVLLLLSGLLEDVPSIVLNLAVYFMGYEEQAFMLSLFLSLMCLGVKSSGLEKMAIYSGRITQLKQERIMKYQEGERSTESKGSKKSN